MFRREDATGETAPRRKDSAARRSELHLVLAAWDEQSCALVARRGRSSRFFTRSSHIVGVRAVIRPTGRIMSAIHTRGATLRPKTAANRLNPCPS